MSSTRIAFLLAFALALGAGPARADDPSVLPVHDGVGGEFSASSSLGRSVSLSDYRGSVVLLFFGYTSCQDVCPVTLAHLKDLVTTLGDAAEDVQVLLATVDPETDTAEVLSRYLARFDERFVGLTGTPAEMAHIAGLFMAEHQRSHDVRVSTQHHRSKAFADETYLYTHSQQIYLLDGQGRTRGMFFSGSPIEEMVKAVHALQSEASAAVGLEPPPVHRDSRGGAAAGGPPAGHHDHDHHQILEEAER